MAGALISILFCALLPGALSQQQRVTPVRESDAACARCHAAIYNSYLHTPKANASGLAIENLIEGKVVQQSSGTHYSVTREGNTAWLRYDDSTNAAGQGAGVHGEHRLDYFLGSGHLGITYLYAIEGYLMESPVAYYSNLHGYGMKPGLANLHEAAPAIPMEPACLRCHMSGVQPVLAGSLNRYGGLPFEHGGITCESCHGDTAAHVLSGGKAPVVNPAKLAPRARDSVCISCHLEGDVAVEKNDRSALHYKPGEDISQYLSFFVYRNADPQMRGVSEVEQFVSSHCKRASGDSMSCTTCHDPHFTPSAEERVAFYRGKCLACHNTGTFAQTHHPENPDCTSCHMPRATADNIPHVAWTDHRILGRPLAASTSRASSGTDYGTLQAVLSPDATPRDHALALYTSVLDGHAANESAARSELTAAHSADRSDVPVLNALATMTLRGGDTAEAAALFRAVLALTPTERTAAINLAILDARAGDLKTARALLEPVFARNEDEPAIANDLATVACAAGDGAMARQTLLDALRFSPGSQQLRTALAGTADCLPAAPAR